MAVDLFGTNGSTGAASGISRALTRTATAGSGGNAFAESLANLVENAEAAAGDANVAITNMVDKSGDVHEAMIALQRAEMTLQLTVQVRNKLVQAYQDIMRMPI
jgi:flagellar hook-basal body complex protein FliE